MFRHLPLSVALSLATGLASALATPLAIAQNYPGSKPVTLIVPFSAGGPTDVLARTLGHSMQSALAGTVIVDNAPGAGGTIGINKVAKAQADGHTLLVMHIGFSTAPALYKSLPYNTQGDFEPVGLIADVPMTLIAAKKFAPNTFPELASYVKANKAKVTLANAGIGSASHLCGLLFQSALEADLTTVPYKGTAPAMNDILGGQVDLLCDQTTNTTGQIRSDKVKAYGVTTKTPVASLPALKPLAQQGLKDFEVAVWHGLWAPKGTPKPVVDKLVAALKTALKDEGLKKRLADLGTEPVADAKAAPEALRAHVAAEINKWGPIIKKAGVYAD